jgi:hypothetical protein
MYCRLYVNIPGYRYGILGSGTVCHHSTGTKSIGSAGIDNRHRFRFSCRNTIRHATCRYAGELDPTLRNTSGRNGDERHPPVWYTPGGYAG